MSRKPLAESPMKQISVRMDEATIKDLTDMGKGNISAGVRLAAEMAKGTMQAIAERELVGAGAAKALAPQIAQAAQDPQAFLKALGRQV